MRRALPLLLVVLCAAWPAEATAARPALETVLQDDAALLHGDDAEVRAAFERLRTLGADRVRLTAPWSSLTRGADADARPDFDATDPAAYEQARWALLDRAVRIAAELGLPTMVDVGFWAPVWAAQETAGPRARTHIDAAAFRDFAVAVARRYSGAFAPPAQPARAPVAPSSDEGLLGRIFGRPPKPAEAAPAPAPQPLPRVDDFALWNEPNHHGFLLPQWRARRGRRAMAVSPDAYRPMVALAYPAMKAVRPESRILVGNTASMGEHAGRAKNGVGPLAFIRGLACVDRRLRPVRTGGCAGFATVPGDGWGHHPYALSVLPDRRSTLGVDDARIGDLGTLTRLLDRLADKGRLAPGLRDVFITEYGYEKRPLVGPAIFGPREQARLMTWSEYLAWRNPRVKSFAQFLLRDMPGPGVAGGRKVFGHWASGLFDAADRPKPHLRAFRVGLFAQRRGRHVVLWGRLRGAGGPARAWIEVRRRGGAWRRVATRAPGGRRRARTLRLADGQVVDRRARPPRRRAHEVRYRLIADTAGGRLVSDEVPLRRSSAPTLGGR